MGQLGIATNMADPSGSDFDWGRLNDGRTVAGDAWRFIAVNYHYQFLRQE